MKYCLIIDNGYLKNVEDIIKYLTKLGDIKYKLILGEYKNKDINIDSVNVYNDSDIIYYLTKIYYEKSFIDGVVVVTNKDIRLVSKLYLENNKSFILISKNNNYKDFISEFIDIKKVIKEEINLNVIRIYSDNLLKNGKKYEINSYYDSLKKAYPNLDIKNLGYKNINKFVKDNFKNVFIQNEKNKTYVSLLKLKTNKDKNKNKKVNNVTYKEEVNDILEL